MKTDEMAIHARNLKSPIAALAVGGLLLAAVVGSSGAQQNAGQSEADRELAIQEMLAQPRPIEAGNSLWIEELTWMEVRDLIADGSTTVIIPTGGMEQNGPYVITGKHNVILEATCPEIAAQLGNALCAPIVKFVPEGDINPPTGAMRFPGSISLQDGTYRALLDDIASSLKQNGFKDIVLIGDSGGNQAGMEIVASELNRRWSDTGTTAHFVSEYYDPGWEETERYTAEVLGVAETRNDGYHDDIWVNAMMMVVDPESVRYQQRMKAGVASINGVTIVPAAETAELGRKMMEFRAGLTADAIRNSIDDVRDGARP